MYRLRNQLASVIRGWPGSRGKLTIGEKLTPLLGGTKDDQSSIVQIRMRAGHRMELDIRSETESWPYWTGRYDDELIRKLTSTFQTGDTVLDVGANVGLWTVPLSRALQQVGGKLFAFEPVKANFARTCKNIELNDLSATAKAFNVALGDDEGEIEMAVTMGRASTGNAIIVNSSTSKNYTSNTRATITRLDRFADLHGIDGCRFIKVDIEGAEILFLRGGREFLGRHRPVVYGEFSSELMTQFGTSLSDLEEILVDYHVFRYLGSKFVSCSLADPSLEDILLVPTERADEPCLLALQQV